MLYEMTTGVHPFRRETPVQTMAAIVEEDAPNISELNPKVPIILCWIIERCLAKDPADRYASTGDLLKDLTTLRDRLPELLREEHSQVVTGERRITRIALLGLAGALLAGAAAAVVLLLPSGTPARVTFTPLVTDASFQGGPAWSPDGKHLAYVSRVNGILQVFTKNRTSSERTAVTASLFDCFDPFWSRDGRTIFYHSRQGIWDSGLWSVSAASGSPSDVLGNATRATLSPDGTALAFFRNLGDRQDIIHNQLWLASSDGSGARRYMEPPLGERTFVDGFARFAPDGTRLLLSLWGWSDDPVPVPSPTFWILPWPTGSPYQILDALADSARTAVIFDWMPDSRHIVAALWDSQSPTTHLWLVDTVTGMRRPLARSLGSENQPQVDPADPARVAFTGEEIDFDLIEIPLDGRPPRPFLETSRNELDPVLAPDGRYFYVTDRRGSLEIWSGSRRNPLDERLVVSANQFPDADDIWALGALAISPDGQWLVYQRYGRRSGYQIWRSSALAAGPAVELATGESYQDAPAWEPTTGEWIAFADWRGETLRLAKVRVGSQSPPELITDDIALFSRIDWAPDGKWILVQPRSGGLAIVRPDGSETRPLSDENWTTYGWAADGQSVIGIREAEAPGRHMLVQLDVTTLQERIVNPDLGEIPAAHQAIRGFSRLGTSGFATSRAKAKSAIYLLEPVEIPGWRDRLHAWFTSRFRR